MDWIRSFQRSIDYIESNITEPLDIKDIAGQMNISPFYFQRIFTMICGFSVGEYIRNRRLALAGGELMSTKAGVLDIALKYGYNAPESFSRAFVKFHGVSPSAVRGGASIRSFARLSVTISMKGGSIMDYRIVKKEAFRVIEKRETHFLRNGENLETIPRFWERSHADGTVKRLLDAASDSKYIFGICYSKPDSENSMFDYSIAVAVGEDTEIPEGFTEYTVPARTWAVFECAGELPKSIQELWHRVVTEFFPSAPYKPTYEMDIEAYGADNYKIEIWVPVIPV